MATLTKNRMTAAGSELLSDHALLLALDQGEEGALRELHRRYAVRFHELARSAQVAHADQAVEDAFVHLSRGISGYQSSFLGAPAWMMGMAWQKFSPHRFCDVGQTP